MAEGKKTFIFYSDWINMVREMPDIDAGALLKHVLGYVNDENPTTDNPLVRMAFGHMKPLIKTDLKKWDVIREKRKEAGSRGGKQTQANAKQIQANAKQVQPVNDNVNVDTINSIYTKFVAEVKSGGFDSRIESMYMRLKIKHGSLTPLLIDFKNHLIEENREHNTTEELFINFKNWVNVQDRIKKLDIYR
jgi:hypothetical protein